MSTSREALGAAWHEVPVWPALCFVDVEVGWFAKPFGSRPMPAA